jgi:hypothetical protein
MPLPSARKTRPKAAVDLPLPLPVWTISRPFSTVLVARILSRAAFFFFIFSAWRASSSASLMPSVMRVRSLSLIKSLPCSCVLLRRPVQAAGSCLAKKIRSSPAG